MLSMAPRETMVMARPEARSSVLTSIEACGFASRIFTLWSVRRTTSVTLPITRLWIDLSGSFER